MHLLSLNSVHYCNTIVDNDSMNILSPYLWVLSQRVWGKGPLFIQQQYNLLHIPKPRLEALSGNFGVDFPHLFIAVGPY